ncbi:hypothetical protein, partial [Bacillus pumilus]|uniref:hypothetical protein n=1 Tax=Bacillus pumilus TaxID=1408 RepID=UPI001C9AD60D
IELADDKKCDQIGTKTCYTSSKNLSCAACTTPLHLNICSNEGFGGEKTKRVFSENKENAYI